MGESIRRNGTGVYCLSTTMWSIMYGKIHTAMGPFTQMVSRTMQHELGIGSRIDQDLRRVLGDIRGLAEQSRWMER